MPKSGNQSHAGAPAPKAAALASARRDLVRMRARILVRLRILMRARILVRLEMQVWI